jgi:hypothetical protein
VTDMQLHNYHLKPILQLSLPSSGFPFKRFIAFASDNVLSLFSTEQDRPLKVMKFYEPFDRLIYIQHSLVVAFNKEHSFKIDLNYAYPFMENFSQ